MSSHSRFSSKILFGLLAMTLLRSQSTVAEDFARASQLVGQRHLDDAIPILESVISRAPRFYPAYRVLVDAYEERHTPEQATAYFSTLLHDPERSAFAHYALGRVAEPESRWDEALDHYAACVQQLPDSVPCYKVLADSLFYATKQSATVEDLASRIPDSRQGPSCLAFTHFFVLQRKITEGLHAAQRCLDQADALGQVDFEVAAHDSIAGAYEATGADHDQALIHSRVSAQLAAQLDDPETAFEHNRGLRRAPVVRHENQGQIAVR